MTIKYLLNKNDKHRTIYRVNFKTMRYALVKTDSDYPGTIEGKFRKGGFKHAKNDVFKQVENPLR